MHHGQHRTGLTIAYRDKYYLKLCNRTHFKQNSSRAIRCSLCCSGRTIQIQTSYQLKIRKSSTIFVQVERCGLGFSCENLPSLDVRFKTTELLELPNTTIRVCAFSDLGYNKHVPLSIKNSK